MNNNNYPSANRDFIFIDESGDPGKVDREDTSDFYMVTALHVTDISMRKLIDHFVRLRYFKGFNKEIKNVYKDKKLLKILLDIYEWINQNNDVYFTSSFLEKNNYSGPYLSEESYGGYNPKYFRNYILKRTLEGHFCKYKPLSKEIEIVIDRFCSKKENEVELFRYLREGEFLPEILHLVQVDSRYTEGIQLTDLLCRVVKAEKIDNWEVFKNKDLNFVNDICLNKIPRNYPNNIN